MLFAQFRSCNWERSYLPVDMISWGRIGEVRLLLGYTILLNKVLIFNYMMWITPDEYFSITLNRQRVNCTINCTSDIETRIYCSIGIETDNSVCRWSAVWCESPPDEYFSIILNRQRANYIIKCTSDIETRIYCSRLGSKSRCRKKSSHH